MDFRSMNRLNTMLNTWSGNFFPLSGEKTSLSPVWTMWVILTWIPSVIYISTPAIGMFTISIVEAVRDSALSLIVVLESVILVVYLSSQHVHISNMIRKMNGILDDSDDLRRCIHESVDPHKALLKIYTILATISIMLWEALPLLYLIDQERDSFTYTDFVVPTWYPGAPFSRKGFIWGVVVEVVGASSLFAKKGGADVYVSYLITLLTAQYRYVRHQMTDALSEINDKKAEELVIASLYKCVRHHSIVMELGQMLGEMLAFNIVLLCLSCVLKLCCLGLCIITTPHIHDKILHVVYAMGTLIQVYMLCLCGQELLDASTTVTDEAFHENWYNRGTIVKKIFRTIGMGNKATCRLTAWRVINLNIPTFNSILNQSYTVLLLVLRLY